MHVSPVWLVPLVAAGVGAGALAAVAGLVRRDVARLQKSLRPLRVPARGRRPHYPED